MNLFFSFFFRKQTQETLIDFFSLDNKALQRFFYCLSCKLTKEEQTNPTSPNPTPTKQTTAASTTPQSPTSSTQFAETYDLSTFPKNLTKNIELFEQLIAPSDLGSNMMMTELLSWCFVIEKWMRKSAKTKNNISVYLRKQQKSSNFLSFLFSLIDLQPKNVPNWSKTNLIRKKKSTMN